MKIGAIVNKSYNYCKQLCRPARQFLYGYDSAKFDNAIAKRISYNGNALILEVKETGSYAQCTLPSKGVIAKIRKMFGQRQSIELSHLDSGKRGDGTRLLIEIAKEAKKRKCDIYTVAVRIDIAKEHPLGFYLKHGFKPIGENSDDIMKAFQGAQEQGHHFDWKGEGVSLKLLYEDLDKLIKNDLF